MRFHVKSTKRPKRHGKLLKRFLMSVGYDVRLRQCHELIAQMLGYADFNELHHSANSAPASLGDAEVDEPTRAERRGTQIRVLIAFGIENAHAAMAVDEVGPTRYGPSHAHDQETETDFERDWGLYRPGKSPVAVVTRLRPTRPIRPI